MVSTARAVAWTDYTDPGLHGARQRAVRAVWAACVLGGLGQSLAGSAGALLAVEVSGSEAPAGLPQAALVLGSAASAVVLSRLTVAYGRTGALTSGVLAAVVGCAVVVGAAELGSLALVLLGSVLLGAGNTAVMLARYAAADLGPAAERGRAMGMVLAATTIGAVTGPNLLAPSSALANRVGWPGLAAPYLLAALAFAAAGGTLAMSRRASSVFERPRTRTRQVGTDPAVQNVALEIPQDAALPWRRPALAGLGVLGLANLVMIAVMTMAPVHLHHLGAGLTTIGLVVSLHIAGMFAPSPLSGWLTDRCGAASTAGLAGATLAIACALAAAADSGVAIAAAMGLLGVGWNLALLSGSALLTTDTAPSARPRAEGWGEVGMGLAAFGGVAASGPVLSSGGYGLVALIGVGVAACVIPLAVVGRDRARRP